MLVLIRFHLEIMDKLTKKFQIIFYPYWTNLRFNNAPSAYLSFVL